MPNDPKTIDESPKISDNVLFELETIDYDGNVSDPYKVDKIIIYFLARDFSSAKNQQINREVAGLDITSYFNKAQVIKVVGNDDMPAWLTSDTDNALIEKVSTGSFEYVWTPQFAREGDYILCYTWTPINAGDSVSDFFYFHLDGDTQTNTSLPSHRTDPLKYSTLLDRYLPEYTKFKLGENDVTPEVMTKLSTAVAKGFSYIEDLTNQSVDLLDANSVHEQMILYLSNMFGLNLRSLDVTLWRRQIKRAIPVFKKKGTLAGVIEALAQAGVKYNSITQLWQVTSPYTWTESFTVTADQTEFELAKNVYDAADFDLYVKFEGEDDYESFSPAEYGSIAYDSDDLVYILTWNGSTATIPVLLSDGDIVKITYKRTTIANPTLESYIQTLPLADSRDETTVAYPPKNWNIRLIEETDELFETICTTRHPFVDPVIYGKIRTEFAYSENVYNSEEYDGSLRDSTNPCHLSKDFLDECTCCLSSKFNIDVEVEGLSSFRMDEVKAILAEYMPFHAQIHSINFQGGINEVMIPQQESIEILINYVQQDTLVNGQDLFTRTMTDGLIDPTAIRREALATAAVAATATGTGKNKSIVLYSPDYRFDVTHSGLDAANNLLEIISGPDAGEYSVINPARNAIDIVQGDPDSIAYPLDTSSFPFRLSNELFSGSVTSITQADIFTFSDESKDLVLNGAVVGWSIEIISPIGVAGTYSISKVYPNDTLILSGWPDAVNRTGMSYNLLDDSSETILTSTTGVMNVTRRALVDGGTDFRLQYQVKQGNYLKVSTVQYLINEFVDDDNFYILGWTAGSVGVTAAKAYRRLADNVTGYLDVKGMELTTVVNYESSLAISNGVNGASPLLDDNQFKQNFLVLIDNKYYQISEIDGTTITLNGPKLSWGLSGTSVDFDIIHFEKESITIQDQTFSFIDRRNGNYVGINQESIGSMAMRAMLLNSTPDQQLEIQPQSENITVGVEWR